MKIKIVYTVPENCYGSADLMAPDGTFIRNLWNHKSLYATRTYTEFIDDVDDLPAGNNYKLRLTTNNIRSYWETVIGNTSLRSSGPTKFYNMEQANDMDCGTNYYYYVTKYNEGKTSCFRIPRNNRRISEAIFPTRGMNASQVCVRNGVVYWAGIDAYKVRTYADELADRWIVEKMPIAEAAKGFPDFTEERVRKCSLTYCDVNGYFLGYRKPETTINDFVKWVDTYIIRATWSNSFSGVWATLESDNSEVEFSFGQKYKPYLGMEYKSMIGIYEGESADITGLAVNDDFIYVSYGGQYEVWYWNSKDTIRVLNHEGKEVNKVTISKPGKMVIVDDFMFYCSGGDICRARLDKLGNIETDKTVHVNATFTVLDVAYYKPTDSIVVTASNGILHYYDRELNLQKECGNKEMYWEKPHVFNDKFYWEDMRQIYQCFICIDPYTGLHLVGDGGNQRIQVFDRNFTYKETISWLSTNYSVNAIDSEPHRIFCYYLEFNRNYAANPKALVCRLAMNWGCYADNEFIYCDMPFVLNGKTYAKQQSVSYNQIRLVELNPEVGLVPLNVIIIPNNFHKSLVQIYPDGCIYRTETKPGYYIKITRQNLLKINDDGTFSWAAPVAILMTGTPPPDSTQNNMSYRIYETYKDKHFEYSAHRNETGSHLTSINISNGTFIENGFPSTHIGYFGEYIDDMFDVGNGVKYAGGIFIVKDGIIICCYRGEFWGAGQVNKWHLFDENLVALHTYGTESKTIRKQYIPHPAPKMAGNNFSGNFVKAGNYYYLYHCDEGHHGGIHSVRFEGIDTVKRTEFPVTVYQHTDNPNVILPLALLPKVAELKHGDGGWNMEPEEGYRISDTDYFNVKTGSKFLSRIEPSDIAVAFRGPVKAIFVSYDVTSTAIGKWSFSGMINFEGNYHSRTNGTTSGAKLQIVDESLNVMFELWTAIDYSTKIVTLYMNNTIIFRLKDADAEKILDYFRNINVWCNNGIISAKYHTYPTVTLGTATAKPAKIRVTMYNTTATTYASYLSIRKLQFNKR